MRPREDRRIDWLDLRWTMSQHGHSRQVTVQHVPTLLVASLAEEDARGGWRAMRRRAFAMLRTQYVELIEERNEEWTREQEKLLARRPTIARRPDKPRPTTSLLAKKEGKR